ncbi:MAG: pyruvate kinase [Spirochaetales bacterium]|uniref:Pyruvate kinase n=1 Tax=Candidatus Thalassospirochaeta sargassi TaxID=3119039 RepID=A0AAJ1MJC0_9SPIO|nr:pyruvate kinase [Spirochaetales bacterium]
MKIIKREKTEDAMRKQTKIVATISDRHCETEFINEMIARGVDVFRLNTAHQSISDSLKVIKNIRAISDFTGILIDTKGPEIRTADLENEIEVRTGDNVAFGSMGCNVSDMPGGFKVIPVSYKSIVHDVPEGSQILIDDGETSFRVTGKGENCLFAEAENDGFVKNRKSVNIPGVHLNLPALTEKDREFIKFAAENDVDFIAHSFVRSPEDIKEINEILASNDSNVKIIAKIENREGVDNAKKILEVCHGIMVARGDLGIEIPAEEVPAIQKRLIKYCVKRAKPVITATQMLQSMIENPRPTRAEVSDVANAVLDGTAALMLSGETAYGKYPLEAVSTMVKIAKASEDSRKGIWKHGLSEKSGEVRKFLVQAAIEASEKLPIKAIIVHTYSGLTARLISSFRGKTPIYVRCHEQRIARELSLSYGLYPRVIKLPDTTDDLIATSVRPLLEKGVLQKDDMIVVLAGSPPLKTNESNMIEINTVSNFIID